MTSQERERMYVANCLICSLAEAMKDCKACPFRIGLLIKAEQEKQEEIKDNVLSEL